jgi:hypothetical protein
LSTARGSGTNIWRNIPQRERLPIAVRDLLIQHGVGDDPQKIINPLSSASVNRAFEGKVKPNKTKPVAGSNIKRLPQDLRDVPDLGEEVGTRDPSGLNGARAGQKAKQDRGGGMGSGMGSRHGGRMKLY